MKRFLVAAAAAVALATTVVSCDKLKPPVSPIPQPRTDTPPPAQDPNASAPTR